MTTVRAALIGGGRMGAEVQAIAHTHDVDIVDVLRSADMSDDPRPRLARVDVAIEFTEPGSALTNIGHCVDAGCPVVVGTSGWYDRLSEVQSVVEKAEGALLWSENFSPGYAVMKRAAESLAEAVVGLEGYDVHLVETHHRAKRDEPSGTAVRLRAVAEGASGRSIDVTSIRTGHVPGVHEVVVDGPFDQVVLRHAVRDRRVFADGALRAARWLIGRTGFYSMDDWVGGTG